MQVAIDPIEPPGIAGISTAALSSAAAAGVDSAAGIDIVIVPPGSLTEAPAASC